MEQVESFSYRIAARTEAAGKYDPCAPREGNEDSFAIIPNVGDIGASVSFDTTTSLPEKGVLMVVADGMGGHNAGEVASQIAVSTVKEMIASAIVSEKDFPSRESRAKHLEKIVKSADQNIRNDAEANPNRHGMGSTIIMAWIVGNELTVTWCGDSRAYRYHPSKGLEMLSEDHSMVQDMVRKKQLKYEETFSHPQGNIITHCLGGGSKGNAGPESRQFDLEDGDLIMLCSDGLSGVLFDDGRLRSNGEPYSDENIQDILSRNRDSLKDTLTCLFDAARRCDWYDNVTAILLQINENKNEESKDIVIEETSQNENPENSQIKQKKNVFHGLLDFYHCHRKQLSIIVGVIVVVLVFISGMMVQNHRLTHPGQDTMLYADTVSDTVEEQDVNAEDQGVDTEDQGADANSRASKPVTKKEPVDTAETKSGNANKDLTPTT